MKELLVQKVYAQVATNFVNPMTNRISTLSQLFNVIINLVLGAGISLVIIMLAMGFIMYVISQGEKAGIEKAQKWVTYAVIGGVGLFFVYVVKIIIMNTFQANNFEVGNNIQLGQ